MDSGVMNEPCTNHNTAVGLADIPVEPHEAVAEVSKIENL